MASKLLAGITILVLPRLFEMEMCMRGCLSNRVLTGANRQTVSKVGLSAITSVLTFQMASPSNSNCP